MTKDDQQDMILVLFGSLIYSSHCDCLSGERDD